VRAHGLLLSLLLLAALLVSLTLAPWWRLYGMVPADRLSSDRLRVTQALATRWRLRAPDILFVGGSQVRESLPEQEFMAQTLSRACGRAITVFIATSSAQPPESSWALLENLGPGAPALVVSGLNLTRAPLTKADASRLARALLPLARPNHPEAWRGTLDLGPGARLQNQLGVLFTDAAQALRFTASYRRDPFYGPHNQYMPPVWSEDRKLIEQEYTWLVGMQTADQALRVNTDFYRSFAGMIRARGGKPVFLLPPAMPGGPHPAALETRLQPWLESLSSAGEVLDLRYVGDLNRGDFFDSVHLVQTGRRKLWPLLEEALRARIPGCAPVPR
jgi:hypothetical protein